MLSLRFLLLALVTGFSASLGAEQAYEASSFEQSVEALHRQHVEDLAAELRALEALKRDYPSLSFGDRTVWLSQLCYLQISLARPDLEQTVAAFRVHAEAEAPVSAATRASAQAESKICEANIASDGNDYRAAYRLAAEAFAYAEQADRPQTRYWVGSVFSSLANQFGDFRQAQDANLLAYRAAEALEDRRRMAYALSDMGMMYSQMKRHDEAVSHSQEALELAESLGLQSQILAMLFNQAFILVNAERWREAMPLLERALEMSREQQDRDFETTITVNLSDLALRAEDWSQAGSLARRALELAEVQQLPGDAATARANLAFALAGQGRPDEAAAQFDRAWSYFAEQQDRLSQSELQEEWSRALARNGRFDAAYSALRAHLELDREIRQANRQDEILELQERFEAEQQQKEIALLSKDNALKSAALENHRLQVRIGLLVALLLTALAAVASLLYLKIRQANRQLEAQNLELEFQRSRDPLTSLYNRRYFQDYIGKIDFTTPERRADAKDLVNAMYLLDLDHFKQINDSQGHGAGDTVLVEVAQRLKAGLRDSDVIMRWGGEEFLVYAPRVVLEEVVIVAERLLQMLGGEPVRVGGKPVTVTASIGYTVIPLRTADGTLASWERIYKLIDQALYLAKSHGRNRAHGIFDLSGAQVETVEQIEHTLEHAWQDGQVSLEVSLGPSHPLTQGST